MPSRSVIIDCDNTAGLPGKEIDDGLALLYLAGRDDIDIAAVCTTFGNDSLDTVHRATAALLKQFGLAHIPLYRGNESPESVGSEAVSALERHLSSEAAATEILALGSFANPGDLFSRRPDLAAGRRVVLMGGTTGVLLIGGQEIRELNVSVAPGAAAALLRSGADLTAVTGNLCLPAVADAGLIDRISSEAGGNRVLRAAGEWLAGWAERVEEHHGFYGAILWDVVAAVCLTNPELFRHHPVRISLSPRELAMGRLTETARGKALIDLPDGILDMRRFWELVIDGWRKAGEKAA